MLPRISQSQQLPAVRNNEEQSLNEVKRKKKELELHAQTVQNRIQQLKNEEQKLQKRIQTTEQLANEVYASRIASKIKRDERNKKLAQQPESTYVKTTLERNYLKHVKQEFKDFRHTEAQNYKQLLLQEQDRYNVEKRRFLESLKLKTALKKQEELLSEALIRDKLLEKKEKVRQEQEREKTKTIQENEEKEKQIKQLEVIELQMVQKLQATQQREKNVKEKLMAATRMEPDQFERTFQSANNTTQIADQNNNQTENKNNGQQKQINSDNQDDDKQNQNETNEGQQGTQTD